MPANAPKEQFITTPDVNAPPARPAARLRMSLEVALDLVVCGVLLVGFSSVAQIFQPDFQRTTLRIGLAGGGLCVLWGVLGRRGTRCRGGAMATLGVVACVFALHVVQSWPAPREGQAQERTFLLIMILLVVFCVGLGANLVREGKGNRG